MKGKRMSHRRMLAVGAVAAVGRGSPAGTDRWAKPALPCYRIENRSLKRWGTRARLPGTHGRMLVRASLIGLALVATLVGAPVATAQNTVLIMGNNDYDPACPPDLPEVIGDVLQKQNALRDAGWTTIVRQNRTAAQMQTDIAPPAGKRYIVWYSGHGVCPGNGALVGVDCANLTPQNLVDSLGTAANNTLVILDSCSGGDFANAVNAINPDIGFITAAGKGEITPDDQPDKQKSPFTECFVIGLNGAADGAGGGMVDGQIRVAEAAAYAIANCANLNGFTHTPTWDGDHADWVIGGPDNVTAGIDVFQTPSGSVSKEFHSMSGGTPLPPDFFFPGSDPFDGVINLQGDAFPYPFAPGDTIIERLEDALLPECPSSDTIAIVFRALSLTSSAPITVTGGGPAQLWDVRVCLSECYRNNLAPCPPLADLTGSMTIRHECPDGGTFDSTLPVLAKFIFTRQSDNLQRELDAGLEGWAPFNLTGTGVGWVHDASSVPGIVEVAAGARVDGDCDGVLDPALPGTWNFFASVLCSSCDCSTPKGSCSTPGNPPHKQLTEEEGAFESHGIMVAQGGGRPALPGWAGVVLAGLLVVAGIFVFRNRRREAAR